jgi:Mobilization protein NikA
MSPRSGSEKRQRNLIFSVRLTAQEAAVVRRKARTQGQSIASLVRTSLLHFRARPSRTDQQAVARLLGELGKIGSNINQIAYHLNAGRPGDRVDGRLEDALRDLSELRIVCLQALGKEPVQEKWAGDED